MTKYLISFPSEAMVVTDEEFPSVVADSHAVIEEAKKAGVYVFGGGIDEQVAPVLVSSDGLISHDLHPRSSLNGGFTILELPTRDDAVRWAAKIAKACVARRSSASSGTTQQAKYYQCLLSTQN